MLYQIKKIYNNYKEIINYLIVGFLTFLISILTYELFKSLFHINYVLSNILSWICAVIFAYIFNHKYVFKSSNTIKIKEFISFISSRLLTLFIETICLYLLVDICNLNDSISKIITQIIVIIMNYLLSKFYVFKDNID